MTTAGQRGSREAVIAVRPTGEWMNRVIRLRELGYENVIILK